MSIDVLKQELSALTPSKQRQMAAFLVSLQDSRNTPYRKKLARKINQPAAKFATLAEMDKRLGLKNGTKRS